MTGGSAGNQSRKFNYALGMAPDEMSAEEIQTLLAVAGKPLADAPLSLDEYETKASESFGLLGCAESDFNVEPDLAESPSDPWFEAEQDAQVVIEIGADIARRYANRELRPGIDVNDVEIVLGELAWGLLRDEAALEALKPQNAFWRGRVSDWARRSAAHFAVAGDSPFPGPTVASYGIEPFLQPIMARHLVGAWTALGIKLLGDFLGDIVRRGHENRDAKGPHRLEVLVCRAVAAGAVTPREILERIKQGRSGGNDSKVGLVAQHEANAEKQRLIDRIRKILKRMKQHPGKVRAEVKAEAFGFPTQLAARPQKPTESAPCIAGGD